MDNGEKKKTYTSWQQDVEIGEDWAGLEDQLYLTGGNNYKQREEALKVAKRIQKKRES
ncbi:hypothetical protein NSA47_11785 [Irregularibacter muris]|uniref:Uncharacterized protein n=1 Tax=Irregularibacter muris TaxID=1796619 RepID=A0AAE3L037_9FIRM|nr:hypothetical protein [Irregularibacter muris]MCR1899656.1 hypothetical protein [Irregularibacter muris]